MRAQSLGLSTMMLVVSVAMMALVPVATATTVRTEQATITGPWEDAATVVAADGDVLAIGAPYLDTADGYAAGTASPGSTNRR